MAQGRYGFHLQVYGEPHEADNPVYVNIVPITIEIPISRHLACKIASIGSIRIGSEVGVGNLGGSFGIPWYLQSLEDGPDGFFVGPIVLISKNQYTREIVISSAIDLGYSFLLSDHISLSAGAEIGLSTFFPPDDPIANRPHFGPAVYLYFSP